MRAVLIYNPIAGRESRSRVETVRRVGEVLEAGGYEVAFVATEGEGGGAAQVRDAVANGAECIFACGGDGTVHDVLQGIVDETRAPGPVLGIIPMGSANALARHLGLSMSPEDAARQQLGFVPRAISVGRIEWNGGHRYFTVLAGAGPDGALVHRMLTRAGKKATLGRIAYYVHAAVVFASHGFAPFEVEFVETTTRERQRLRAVSAMALRIDDMGGLFGRLARGGRVHHPHLRLVMVRPPGWFSLPLWFAMGWLGMSRWNPWVRSVDADEFSIAPVGTAEVHIQADGEWLGTAPMRVALVHDAVLLLMPQESS